MEPKNPCAAILEERGKTEKQYKEANRLLLMLSACNEKLVRAADEPRFLKDVCDIIVNKGQYRLVWIGKAEHDAERSVRAIAQHGFEQGYLGSIRISWADDQWGRGPTGTAIRTGSPSICRNIQTDPRYSPWQEEAKKRGYHSSIALPLICNEAPLGVLNIYSGHADAFDEQEIQFLTELASDIAWGMQSLRTKKEHLQALNTIRESDAMLKAIFNAANDGILVADGETHKFITANRAICEMLGYTLEELTRLEVRDIHPLKDLPRIMEVFERQLRQEISLARDLPVKRKNGSVFLADISTAPTTINNRLCAIGLFRDNSERRAAEKRLLQSQKLEAIGTLAGGIAHDFNNILSPIFGYTEILLAQSDKDHIHAKYLSEILVAAHRARELVKQIVAFSRKSSEELKPLLPQPLIKESLKLLRSSLPSTIEIRQDIDTPCGPILADPAGINTLLMNLCANAFHAMREHGGLLKITLRPVVIHGGKPALPDDIEPGNYVQLIVSDTGHGIPTEVMEHMFEPYFTTQGKHEGTGLGLSVVHGIVITHKGHIIVRSVPNKGTRVEVFFPRLPVVADSTGLAVPAALAGGRENILVVDDEEAVSVMTGEMLVSLGYRVTTAVDSRQAVEVFRNRPDDFHLVVTDLTMPGLSGLELAQALREIRPDIPIILTSGFSSHHTEEKAKAIGIQASLMKPVSIATLSRAIRDILENGRSGSPPAAQ